MDFNSQIAIIQSVRIILKSILEDHILYFVSLCAIALFIGYKAISALPVPQLYSQTDFIFDLDRDPGRRGAFRLVSFEWSIDV